MHKIKFQLLLAGMAIIHRCAYLGGPDNMNPVLETPEGTITIGTAANESPEVIAATPDNGYIVGGYTDSFPLLIKINENLETQWTCGFLPFSDKFKIESVAVLLNGDLLVAGYGFNGDSLCRKICYSRVDAQGNVLWKKNIVIGNYYYRTMHDEWRHSFYSYDLTTTGLVLVGAEDTTFGFGNAEWMMALDVDGDTAIAPTVIDSNINLEAIIIKTTGNGHVVIAKFDTLVDFVDTLSSMHVDTSKRWVNYLKWMELDGHGRVAAAKKHPGGGHYLNPPTIRIHEDRLHNLLVYWIPYALLSYQTVSLDRYNPSGDKLPWEKGSMVIAEYVGWDFQLLTDDGFVVFGLTRPPSLNNNQALLGKFSDKGDSLWVREYGGYNNDNIKAVAPLAGGGCIVAAETWSYGMGKYGSDIWIFRVDSAGDFVPY